MYWKKRSHSVGWIQDLALDPLADPFCRRQVAHVDNRGLNGAVRFFIDYAIGVAVASVTKEQACSAKLQLWNKKGDKLDVTIATAGDGENFRFVAYTNALCFFVGSVPALYVVNHTGWELEQSIYLYISERFAGDETIYAAIERHNEDRVELPLLEGCSDLGPSSLKPRLAAVGH